MALVTAILLAISAVLGPLSMTPQAVDGGYKMVITGNPTDVAAICAQVDCNAIYPSSLDANNAFSQAFGRAIGAPVVPIPPPPG